MQTIRTALHLFLQLTCQKDVATVGGMRVFPLFAVCLGWAGIAGAAPLEVASLSTVLTDLAESIGGDRVEVRSIVKPGMDPHVFEPSPGDIKEIAGARVVLASGLGFEGYLENLRSAVGAGPVFFVAGDYVKPIMTDSICEHGHDHSDHAHGPAGEIPDPHWWHSVRNVQAVAGAMAKTFTKVDPAGRETYEKNAAALDKRLAELAKWVRLRVALLPKSRRVLVTSHDALGYFAKEHGFEVRPVQGISTSDQPSSQKVRALIEEIRSGQVKAIFAENIENPKVLREITAETGAKLGGTLYADGLGTGETGTYEGMMRHNVGTIVQALQ